MGGADGCQWLTPRAGRVDVTNVMMALFSLGLGTRKARPAPPPPPPARPALRPPLPASLLEELVGLVGLDALYSRRPEDRRRRPRLERESDIAIDADLPTGRVTLAAHVGDVSAEGMSFSAKAPLPPGTPFHATLVRLHGHGFVELTGAVRRCERQPDGRFSIGGSFTEYRVYAAAPVPAAG